MERGHSTQGFHGKPPVAWADALAEDRRPWPPVLQHCWYDGPYGRQAALRLGWRSVEGHYDGQIQAMQNIRIITQDWLRDPKSLRPKLAELLSALPPAEHGEPPPTHP